MGDILYTLLLSIIRLTYNITSSFIKSLTLSPTSSRHNRDFTQSVKDKEKISANYKCRMCGSDTDLQCAHIYTASTNPSWQRQGSDPNKQKDSKYVRSLDNCLLLCRTHHRMIDSTDGRKLYTVEYLESLKRDLVHCTTLVGNKRCLRKSYYKCTHHKDTIHVPSTNKKIHKKNQSEGLCIVS